MGNLEEAPRALRWVLRSMAAHSSEQAQLRLMNGICGSSPQMRSFGPRDRGLAIGTYADYPAPGLRTHVTFGASQVPWSKWRGLSLSRELTMTLDASSDTPELLELLMAAVIEDHRLVATRERRRFLEYNGIWAPGYPPHLVFSTGCTATPELTTERKHKLGDRYVVFLSAVPIDDREMREYDRDVAACLGRILESGRIATYPRPAP